jgi:Ca2+:H+ antiporter
VGIRKVLPAPRRRRLFPSGRHERLPLYAAFVFTQTVRHRDFFLPVSSDEQGRVTGVLDLDGDDHADPPDARGAWRSLGLLIAALVSVVGLAKLLSPTIEDVVQDLGFPYAVVGVVIALLLLAPESISAIRNAARDRVQTSLNLGTQGSSAQAFAALGDASPSIGRWATRDDERCTACGREGEFVARSGPFS